MSRSFFSSHRATSHEQQDPLLRDHYQDSESVSLQNLSPREESSRSAAVSPSPPPSFYRDQNATNGISLRSPGFSPNGSARSSRHSGGFRDSSQRRERRIQFANPPPPIVGSVMLPHVKSTGKGKETGFGIDGGRSSSPRIRRGSGGMGMDPLIGLERKERAIHAELQSLLDAQSAGLLLGFGGESAGREGSSDAGSSTPTTRSLARNTGSGGGITPVRQPKRKVISLRGARRGLLRDMGELVEVKNEEVSIIDSEISTRADVLDKVAEWEKRIEDVRKQLQQAENTNGEASGSEESNEIAELRTEERAVDNEIREMEDRLLQMKARKRWLGERIKESTNRLDARLSSYRGALREVDSEVRQFLKRPPVPVSAIMGGEEGFMELPASRRTLGMAKEWWDKEVSTLQSRRTEVAKEKEALEEGAQIWSESINAVVDFEDDLRKQMVSNMTQDPELLKAQISKMGEVITKLDGTFKFAETKGWNLLICAIGAELEAFKEGHAILTGALAMMPDQENGQEQKDVLDLSDEHDEHEMRSEADTETDSVLNELNGHVDGDQEQIKIEGLTLGREGSVSEDDGPNLDELMVDRS